MDDQVWCGLDLQLPAANDVAGLHRAADDDLPDSFWPSLADCAASFLAAGDDGIDITGSAGSDKVAEDMVLDVDTTGCFEQHDQYLMTMRQQEQMSSSPLTSSKRSLSIDSASSPFSFDAAALTAAFSSAPPVPHDPFAADDDDAAIMRAMMAVLSSASPSSSEYSSSPPRCHEISSGGVQQATVYSRLGNDNNSGHVDARTASLAVAPAPETNTAASLASSGWQQQQDGAASGSSSQVYHMMSERKRREKLNDSFHTLRSLLPPCSKKDKTTVLINAASYLKKLEVEVTELEEKNAKLERHIPREDGGAATATAHRRAKVQISRATTSDAADQVNLTVIVMVECDIVDLVLHVLESLRWMAGVSVLSVDADTYSPQVLLKAIASIKLQITDGDCWNEASFHEAMKKVVHDATSSPSIPCATAAAQLVSAA